MKTVNGRPSNSAPTSPAPVPAAGTVPHELAVAHAALARLLSEEMDFSEQTGRLEDPRLILDAIERFVHELRTVPGGLAELERRVSFVETQCAAGSPYDAARQRAVLLCPTAPEELCRARCAIEQLHPEQPYRPPYLAAEVDAIRHDVIKAILEEPSLELTSDAKEAFVAWHRECRNISFEAVRLGVDGCRHLYHIGLNPESDCLERSEMVRAFIETGTGGGYLVPIKTAADSLVAWVRTMLCALPAEAGRGGSSQSASTLCRRGSGRRSRELTPKRSWTQRDLDNAIWEYKAARASTYGDLVHAVKHRKRGAMKDARRIFGQRAIATALGVKARSMVGKSPVWQAIADELRLRGRTKGAVRRQRIGMAMALEEQAVSSGDSAVDELVRGETIRLIELELPPTEAEATIEKLQRGDITDDEARRLVDLVQEQRRDAKR